MRDILGIINRLWLHLYAATLLKSNKDRFLVAPCNLDTKARPIGAINLPCIEAWRSTSADGLQRCFCVGYKSPLWLSRALATLSSTSAEASFYT